MSRGDDLKLPEGAGTVLTCLRKQFLGEGEDFYCSRGFIITPRALYTAGSDHKLTEAGKALQDHRVQPVTHQHLSTRPEHQVPQDAPQRAWDALHPCLVD